MIVLSGLLIVNIFGRLLGRPIIGTYELVQYGFALVVCLAIGYTALEEGHIAVELVFDRFPPRVRSLIAVINTLLVSVLSLTIAYRLLADGLEALGRREMTSTLGLPMYAFQFALAFGFALLAVVAATKLAKR